MIWLLCFLGILCVGICDFNLLLLHTNDMHSRFMPTNSHLNKCDNQTLSCYGGFARLRYQVEAFKKKALDLGRQTIFLNTGDTFQGTPYYTFFKWRMAFKMINSLGLDIMSLGSHEFDDGVAGLEPFITNVKVPIVCSNLDLSQEPALQGNNVVPSHVLELNGTKVGIIGYLTPDAMRVSTGKLKILSEIPKIRAEAQALLEKDIHILIAIGHSGFKKDLEIAKEVEEIDLVVGGRSHTFLYSGNPPDIEKPEGPYPTVVTQASGKKVPVVQAYFGTKYLGNLELVFDNNGNLTSWTGSPSLLSGNVTEDPIVQKIIEPFEEEMTEKARKTIGYTLVPLDNSDGRCSFKECSLGNLISDAYVDYVAKKHKATKGWTTAAVAIVDSSSIFLSLSSPSPGQNRTITKEDVMSVVPAGGPLVIVNITGHSIKEAIERGLKHLGKENATNVPLFLQVSGLSIEYDKDRQDGSRVITIRVRCANCEEPKLESLVTDHYYRVVMTQHLAQLHDDIFKFSNASDVQSLYDLDYEVVCKYIEAHSPLNVTVEGRIFVGQPSVTHGYLLKNIAIAFVVFFICFFVVFFTLRRRRYSYRGCYQRTGNSDQ